MLRFLKTCKLMRTLFNGILLIAVGNNCIIKLFSGYCDYKLRYHRYSVSVMPILSMKLFDHFGNHILDLNKAHYITYNILIKLNQRRCRYFITPKKQQIRNNVALSFSLKILTFLGKLDFFYLFPGIFSWLWLCELS